MRVEVIDNENPFGRRVEIHGSFEVRDELGFGAGRLECGGDDLSRDDIQAGGQRGGAVTRVLTFPTEVRFAVG